MEISDLILSGEKLLTLLKSSRYSDDYRWKIGGCVKFLKSNRNNTWESYEDIAEAFSSNPAHKRNDGKKSYFSFVLYYHLNQALPGYHSIRNVTNRKCALNLLNEYYKRLALIVAAKLRLTYNSLPDFLGFCFFSRITDAEHYMMLLKNWLDHILLVTEPISCLLRQAGKLEYFLKSLRGRTSPERNKSDLSSRIYLREESQFNI